MVFRYFSESTFSIQSKYRRKFYKRYTITPKSIENQKSSRGPLFYFYVFENWKLLKNWKFFLTLWIFSKKVTKRFERFLGITRASSFIIAGLFQNLHFSAFLRLHFSLRQTKAFLTQQRHTFFQWTKSSKPCKLRSKTWKFPQSCGRIIFRIAKIRKIHLVLFQIKNPILWKLVMSAGSDAN